MAAVRRSINFSPEVWNELVRQAAGRRGGVSALVNAALDSYLRIQRGRTGVAEWEADHGLFTAEEIAEADHILDAAGIPRR